MGRRSIVHSLIAVVLITGVASGFAQLDTSDIFGTSSFGLRRLSAYYARNFATQFPTSCYQSSYFSPFRTYFKDYNFSAPYQTYKFQLDVSTCPYSKSDCCRLWLDHMVIRTSSSAKVLGVALDGQVKEFDVGPGGLTIYRMRVDPTVMRSMLLEITTPIDGYNYVSDLCPQGRYPGTCDVIAYDETKTCCSERAALDWKVVFPSGQPPVGPTDSDIKAPPPQPSPPLPPSPPPPSPPSPSPPPPPPPDGWDQCCVDDPSNSPFNLKYNGYKLSGSDTAFLFSLTVSAVDNSTTDDDGLEMGDCSSMDLRDLGVIMIDGLPVKSVLFNGTVTGFWNETAGIDPQASSWLYVTINKPLKAFDPEVPIDVVITVRGQHDMLCPANTFLQSTQACEFVMHGKDAATQCCPHGITRRAGPFDDCCVDDITKSPYRMDYYGMDYSTAATVYDFGISVMPVSNTDFDEDEDVYCDHMTLDTAQIQLYKQVEVLNVTWNRRIMNFTITAATEYANWLTINNINSFINDYDPNLPTMVKVTVRGGVRELCPAGWLLGADSTVMCEYAFQGTQGNSSCCPHDVTQTKSEGRSCGCRDDVPGTPYRLGYSLAASGDNQTMFNFDLAKVDPTKSADFDGEPDLQFGAPVSCSNMGIKDILFVVRSDIQVQAVTFNGLNYAWQFESYTDTSVWLRILGIDIAASDLPSDGTVPLQILVNGDSVSELCPASSLYASQSSCEYMIYGLSGADECCPNGVTSWSVPSLLQGR